MLLAPPTAARAFVQKDAIKPLGCVTQLSQQIIVIVIIGWTGL
jgi:hypothetical protein